MTQTLTEIRSLLAARGIRPKHRLGQNFLHDHNILRILVDAAGLPERGARAAPPVVLEVGPGTGALTEVLLERGARVIACEIDRDMIEILRERVMPRAQGRLTIVEGDCLDGKRSLAPALLEALHAAATATEESASASASSPDPAASAASTLDRVSTRRDLPRFRLVSNLPYGSATPLIATLLCDHPECDGLFATIQREVADRLAARPGSDAYGPLTVGVSLLARVERVAEVAPGCFWPAPEVSSAIVAVHPRGIGDRPPELDRPEHARRFQRFVTEVFSKRRKQLGSILGRGAALPPGVHASQRAEELAPDQWLALWQLTQATAGDRPSE